MEKEYEIQVVEVNPFTYTNQTTGRSGDGVNLTVVSNAGFTKSVVFSTSLMSKFTPLQKYLVKGVIQDSKFGKQLKIMDLKENDTWLNENKRSGNRTYRKDPEEQRIIVKQSTLGKAVDLFIGCPELRKDKTLSELIGTILKVANKFEQSILSDTTDKKDEKS